MKLVIGFLFSVLLACQRTEANTNLATRSSEVVTETVATNNPVELEFQKIMAADDLAHEEIDKWIKDSYAFEEKGAGSPQLTLNARIKRRQEEVKKLYTAFLEKNPKHARARLAYGSFLNDAKDDFAAAEEWEKARELDPKNPAAWNNLANFYGHRSPVEKSFEYYAKAIELDPTEPVYVWNFASTVYLFRKHAMEHYKISEDEVYAKALELYQKAMKLDPKNFILFTEYAEAFYGTKPPRYEDGVKAWEEAYKLARDAMEREGVLIHLARCKINLGKFADAEKDLNSVTNKMYLELRQKLERKLARDKAAKEKNAPPDTTDNP